MKNKAYTLLLGVLVLLISTAYYFDVKAHKKTILDREYTIINYQKVIDAIGRTGNVSVEDLKIALKRDFAINEKTGFNSSSKEYYCDFHPKMKVENPQKVGDFIGFELILNEHKELKIIQMYKP